MRSAQAIGTHIQIQVGRGDESSKAKTVTLLLGPCGALVVKGIVDQTNSRFVNHNGLQRSRFLDRLKR
jgi:hypothetical protein